MKRRFSYCSYMNDWKKEKRPPKPVRKTKKSAGYDFYSPETVTIQSQEMVKIRTGVKVKLNDDEYLALHIRSSLGIKHGIMLANCTGIIDADYYNNPDNEGEIIAALVNIENVPYTIHEGDAIMQGIICKYYTVDDDKVDKERKGGIGSTGK